MKKEVIQKIIDLTKTGKIKSFHYNNEYVVDLLNIKLFNLFDGKDIKISKKYVPLLKEFSIEEIRPFLLQEHNFNLITNNKFITFNISAHSAEQFLKRMLFIYIESEKFEFSIKMQKVYANYIDKIIDLLKQIHSKQISIETLVKEPVVHELLKIMLSNAESIDTSNLGRRRDKRALNYRNQRYKKFGTTIRYFNHPFMFVVQEDILKTVELYSSSEDCRHLNKITSTNEFYKWFQERF